ncbi:fibronectin type III domain-containing protein [Knoellia sp. 3-2P3]|uniref:fibronectin type III domain-containing protein n=1 Tax=unclassified Knoellia TaxID=2618719 RepID=UPI0023DA59C3|nr:fibronectin type III domain-containing protein [Knoellia sp. 3-2P3]MDF2094112.1 fibronectin type III domain-containing protein [Knoellia sp. 3-2P3]
MDFVGRRGGARRRWLVPVTAAALVVGLHGLSLALPAEAQILGTPARTWGVGPAETTVASIGKPRVLAILPIGDRIVVGGTFDTVIDPAGREYPAKNIAVFSATTGAADLTFRGSTNNTVTSLATDGAGTVFVGGDFGTVNGQTRRGLAALSVATGDLRAWAPSIVSPGQVDALAYAGGSVYAGGNFAGLTGGGATSKAFLAKVSASTGAVDASWAPAPNDRVRTLNVAADGSGRLFAGGDFTAVSAKSSTNKIAAVFLGGAGAVDTAFRAGPANSGSYSPVFDLTSDASRVYAAAAGGGGACTALSTTTGATLWSDRSNGNLQSVRLHGGLLYCAGHFSGTGSFMGQTRYKIAAVVPSTGALTAFAPKINSSQGPWALATDATRVYIGGDFSTISRVAQPHFAMFIDSAAQTAPQRPASLTAQASNAKVNLSWGPPSSDGGSGLQKYKVYRATSPGGHNLGGSPLATLSKTTMTYADTSVTNGVTYYYVVVATNAVGSSAPSVQVAATPSSTAVVTKPGAPTGLTATPQPGAIRLAWNPPSDTGGASITSYRVYRGPAGGQINLTTPVATTSSTMVDDTSGLTAGSSYSYVVKAVNQAGEGAASTTSTATAMAGTPGEPVLTGSLGAGPSAVLKWTVPPNGGSPITKYVILKDAVRLVSLSATVTGPTTYTDTTLASKTSAVYQVKAVNDIGSGPLSAKVTVTAP